MALAPQAIPLNSSTLPPLHFLVFQPQSHAILKFRVSCSNQTAQVDTQPAKITLEAATTKKSKKKKRNNPRPSFFDQIRDKWCIELGSQREKLPWQEPELEEEEQPQEHEREQKEQCEHKSSASYPLNFQFPKRLSPWPQAANPTNPQFDSDSDSASAEDNGKPLQHSFRGSGIDIEKTVKDVGEISGGVKEEKSVRGERQRRSEISKESASSEAEEGDPLNDLAPEIVKEERKSRTNTELAEKLIPEHELRRLRNVALRMVQRFEVGVTGITQELVASIHDRWRDNEVVKLKFETPLSANMKMAHHILESKTGGLVVWRSGSSVVLYRGITYKLPCVQSYTKMNHAKETIEHHPVHVGSRSVKEPVRTTESFIRDPNKYKDMTEKELKELIDLDHLLDELGPRFEDWTGREPLPVDADLLPAVVPGYKTPFRLLPYGVRHSLSNKEMTIFRRLARTTAPHFALGRNRELQGLASAMVKLWETSAIAKIAIKRGVSHTCNERMAEELRKLTGGTLLSRNKEYIVFYRGNDFLPPAVTNTLTERQKLNLLQQDEEEKARQIASSITGPKSDASQPPLVAGTLAETKAATTKWGHQPSREEVEKMMRDSALDKLTSFIRHLEKKLALAKAKSRKAEKALAKVQGDLEPADLPTDLETLTNEERFLFRKIGLSMKPYLLLGRRDVYAGTIENMHLHWKYRELVKIIVRGRNLAQVKHIAISLEAESGGVLVSLDKDNKGYIIIVYRGKNYSPPRALKPENLLTRRQALARSVELQRREALRHHILDLEERIELLKSELEDMRNEKEINFDNPLYSTLGNPVFSDDDLEEREEAEIFCDKVKRGEDEKNQTKLLDLV